MGTEARKHSFSFELADTHPLTESRAAVSGHVRPDLNYLFQLHFVAISQTAVILGSRVQKRMREEEKAINVG